MEQRARDEERDKEYKARAKVAAAKAAAELVVTKDSAIRLLQRVYRGYVGRVKGKVHMRNERLLVRNAYWANKADRKRRGTDTRIHGYTHTRIHHIYTRYIHP